jgi:hypothetical protein
LVKRHGWLLAFLRWTNDDDRKKLELGVGGGLAFPAKTGCQSAKAQSRLKKQS